MKACAACGEENPDRARFCLACGAALAPAEAARREERKIVTVLFADLVGFTGRAERLDPEEVRAVLQPYHARLRAELERFGGTVEKFIGDAAMAVFGAPTAHEDDPERAARAALAIREALEEEGELHVRIGITTGEALVALGARPAEGEGMASGDVVNTAARLQTAAPVDGVLVDDATYRATERAIVYRRAEPVVAKGKAAPVRVWEAVEARARLGVDWVQRGRAQLVGRERELDLLLGALARARSGPSTQLVTLVGVPGIGKSRLVWELAQRVEAESELVFWRQGRSLPYGEGITFWALGEMAKAHAGILETDTAEAAHAKLSEAVRELLPDEGEAAWVEAHLGSLVGSGGEAEPGSERRSEAFAAWRRFFEALAERSPTVLVFEDLHWADEGVLDFVDHLVDWAGAVPLLVVCTARPELLARRPGWGGGKPNAVTLSLPPLADGDVAVLLAALLERPVLPMEIQATLLARAGGNPLYAEEYARMLADRGDGADLELPETVQGIVAARLDVLSPEEKELLQDAAVLGKVFWLGALAHGGRERWGVEELLHGLERKEFVRRERRSSVASETEYVFRHILVRDVAYGQIPRAQRGEKHRRAAEWIESLGRPEDHAEMLGHHYLAALEFARAAGHPTDDLTEPARIALREAGDRALALSAFTPAARFYRDALALWPAESEDRPLLLFHYAKAVSYPAETGFEELTAARDALLAAGDRATAAEAASLLGGLYWRQAQRDRAFEHMERAHELVADAAPSPSKASVLAARARALMLAEETEEAARASREALAMAEELGLDELRADALNNLGLTRIHGGDLGGIDDLEQSLAITAELRTPEVVRSYINLASTFADLGRLERSFGFRAEGSRAAERFSDVYRARWLEAERAFELYWTGRWDEAETVASEFIQEAQAGAPHYMAGGCYWVRSHIKLARGDTAGADADAVRGDELSRGAKDPQNLYPDLAAHARVFLRSGRRADAVAAVDELLARSRERPFIGTFWTADVAVVLDELGRPGDLPAHQAMETRWLEAARAYLGRDFQRAAAAYAQIGSRPDEAFARLRAAEALLEAGRRADAEVELARASEFFRGVGATAYLRQADGLLPASA